MATPPHPAIADLLAAPREMKLALRFPQAGLDLLKDLATQAGVSQADVVLRLLGEASLKTPRRRGKKDDLAAVGEAALAAARERGLVD